MSRSAVVAPTAFGPAPLRDRRVDLPVVGGVEPDEREVVVGAGVGVGLALGLHREPRVVDERAGLRGAVDLDGRADRERAGVAAVGLGRGAGAGAVGGLADVDVGGVGEDEVGRALATCGVRHDARMDGGGRCGRPRRSRGGGGRREGGGDEDADEYGEATPVHSKRGPPARGTGKDDGTALPGRTDTLQRPVPRKAAGRTQFLSVVDVLGRAAMLPVAHDASAVGDRGAVGHERSGARRASPAPRPRPTPAPRPGGSRAPRSASISTVVVPAGRPSREIQRRSTSAALATAWRSPSSSTSANANTGRPGRERLEDRQQRRQPRLVGREQGPVGLRVGLPVRARARVADRVADRRALRPRRGAPDVAVDVEVDVDRRLRRVEAAGP